MSTDLLNTEVHNCQYIVRKSERECRCFHLRVRIQENYVS